MQNSRFQQYGFHDISSCILIDVFEVFSLQGYCKSELLLGDDYLLHRDKHENNNSYSGEGRPPGFPSQC